MRVPKMEVAARAPKRKRLNLTEARKSWICSVNGFLLSIKAFTEEKYCMVTLLVIPFNMHGARS
jgi:hypothetical protein